MMKKITTYLMMFLMLIGMSAQSQDLVITGIIDGPLPGGLPKAVELHALNNIADLSVYGIEKASNGNPSSGQQYAFPADVVNQGDFIYLAYDDATEGFNAFFGIDPNYVHNVANHNGDDAIILYANGSQIDVFGVVGTDGTGEPWECLDGWAYRNSSTGPDGNTFVLGNWSFSGVDALDGETTNATAATPFPIGTYTTGPPTTVSTPVISPGSGNYTEPVDVTMTCGTDGATIYYTTDGTDPDNGDTEYASSFEISTNTTVKAKAYKAGLDPSSITTVNYNFPTTTQISTIAQLRTQTADDGSIYELTGEAILTFQQSYRGQKYIQDVTAAIFIDDNEGNITTTYNIYDGLTGITGELVVYGDMLQFVPISDPGTASSNGNTITPEVVTLDDLFADFEEYEAELVKIEDAVFSGAGGIFETNPAQVYEISDGSKAVYNFRTSYYDVDYIGETIPSGPQNLILLPHSRTDGEFVASRSLADMTPSSSNPAAKLDIIDINGGADVYENQPFTVTVQAQDAGGVPAPVDSDIIVTLSVGTGSGSLGGNISGTIFSGTTNATISGVTYDTDETEVVLNITGVGLTAGTSDAFNVLEVIIPDILITEIMYNALPGSDDSLEYIELYNNGSTINLVGYEFTSGVELTFSSVTFNAGDYLLVSRNASAVQDILSVSSIQWEANNLSNGGELIELSDASGSVVTSVEYSDGTPWPIGERGKSIRFCDLDQAQNAGESWSLSEEFLTTIGGEDIYGTPLADCGAASLIANFTASNTEIAEGDAVDFTDTSTGEPTSWAWTFEGGNPSSSTDQNPSGIVYDSEGTYDVSLLVTKGAESDTETKTDYITVAAATNPATNLDITAINGGNDVYEGIEFSVTVNSLDAAGGPANVDADLLVTLSLNTGTGTLGGTLTGTIAAGTSTVTISGVTYGPHESGVVLKVSGTGLTDGTSSAFNVIEAIIPDLVITEIMYNAMPNTDTLEYIEFYNNGAAPVNLENFKITKGVSHTFDSYVLNAGSYVLVAGNSSAIQDAFSKNAIEWTSGGLSNSGEEVNLLTSFGAEVTYVNFGIAAPWPAKETGKSIRFCNPNQDNNNPENWSISIEPLATIDGLEIFGTPLAGCGVASLVAEFTASATDIETGQSIDFTDLSTGSPTEWAWTFEGGTPASSDVQNPQGIVYNTAGTYDVVLTITGDDDSNTETKTNYITVVNPIIPPVASFTADMTTIFVGQSVQFTNTSTNNPDTYDWTFEGGTPTSSSIANPNVSYNTAGIYDVSLSVENGGGEDELVEVDYITVLPATIGDLVITEIMYNPPESGDDSLEYIELYNNSDEVVDLLGYSFTAGVEYVFPTIDMASGEYIVVAKNASAMQNTFGVTAYEWTSGALGNGGELIKLSSPLGITIDSVPFSDTAPWPTEADGNGPSISICDPEVENSIGENWHASVQFLAENANGDAIYGSPGTAPFPVANFIADDLSIIIDGQVQFTNLSSCNYTSVEWVFEGGTPATSTDEDPLVTYETAGLFDVTLTVSNAIGSHVLEMTDYIEVIDPTEPPIADFSSNLTLVFEGQSILFTDLSENEPLSYTWTFEGGTPETSSSQNPVITYNTAGTYDVTLYVENSAGNDEMVKTDYITVLPATVGDLVITEIMYNPPESGDDSLEYIEIYNNSDELVNLTDYSFTSGIEYVFPGIEISSGDYLVIAKDSMAVLNTLGLTAYEWFDGSLSNGGELIKLSSPMGVTVDSVPYSDMAPWPEDGDGTGPSITICDPESENSVGENWHASVHYIAENTNGDAIYGSPGMAPAPVANFEANDLLPSVGGQVEFTELSICNADSFEWEFEGGTPENSNNPNPTITYSMAGDFDVSLTVTNSTGSHTYTMVDYIMVGVGIAEQSLAQISVMPNPSTGLFNLHNPSNEEISVSVYSVLGKLIYQNHSVLAYEQIDLTTEEDGIYLIHMMIDGESKTIRIIKQ